MEVLNSQEMDGSYGWVVTFACFSVCFIMQGLARAAGVLYVAIIELYGVSRKTATTPFTLRFAMRNMMGPLVGILAQRFGMRFVVVTGGIFASIGGAFCAMANDVFYITMLWGIVHGIGYGLCSTIHVMILNEYFEKYKATAIAIALTGDCVGTFVFPVLLESLIFKYGVDGTFLILGAICLNIIPAGLIMKSPCQARKTSLIRSVKNSVLELSNYECHGVENKSFEISETGIIRCEHMKDGIFHCTVCDNNRLISNLTFNQVEQSLNENSETKYSFNNPVQKDKVNINMTNVTIDENKLNQITCRTNFISKRKDSLLGKLLIVPPCITVAKNDLLFDKSQIDNKENISFRKFSMPIKLNMEPSNSHISSKSVSLEDIKGAQLGKLNEENPKKIVEMQILSKQELLTGEKNVPTSPVIETECNSILHDTLSSKNKDFFLDRVILNSSTKNSEVFSIGDVETKINNAQLSVNEVTPTTFTSQFINLNIRPLFLVIGLNLASYSFVLIAVITILVDYSTDNGISSEISKYFVIGFSAADLIGRVGFGVILDKKWMKLSCFSCGNMIFMGIAVLIVPFFSNYWYIMSCMILFGLMQGGNAIIYPLLVGEYMNKGEENIALGCLNFYGGIIMFPVAPMIGFFRDTIGNYNGVFYSASGLCIFAGLLWFLEPYLLKVHKRMSRKTLR